VLGRLGTTWLVVLSVALGASACTPDRKGAVGISRSLDGHLVAVVAGCGTEFEQLYASSVSPQTSTSFASWKLPKATGATVDLDLQRTDDPGRHPAELPFHGDARYSLYASVKTSLITDGVEFTPADVLSESADVVLYAGRTDKDEPVVERGTREEFAAAVCTQQ
jgi:hypothetical protein